MKTEDLRPMNGNRDGRQKNETSLILGLSNSRLGLRFVDTPCKWPSKPRCRVKYLLLLKHAHVICGTGFSLLGGGGGEGTPYYGLYRKAMAQSNTFFRLEVYQVRGSSVEVKIKLRLNGKYWKKKEKVTSGYLKRSFRTFQKDEP